MTDVSRPLGGLESRLADAAGLLRSGRPIEAAAVLDMALRLDPRSAPAWRLRGLAAERAGDLSFAEQAFRRAAALAPFDPTCQLALAEFLARGGGEAEAERLFRALFAKGFTAAAAGLAHLLVGQARVEEALQATAPLCGPGQANPALLAAHASALKASGDLAAALDAYRRVVALSPASAVAEHNAAAVLADLLRFDEAEAAARRARAKGLDAAETWLVLARALQGQDRADEAEAAYREALRRRPGAADVHRELAQLIWMRTGDLPRAVAPLDAELAAQPEAVELILAKARLLDSAGHPDAARRLLTAADRMGASAPLQAAASHALLETDPEAALAHAEQAVALAPGDRQARAGLCAAWLAVGDGPRAAEIAAALRAEAPLDQHAIALQATAWRLMGDPRYGALHDYGRLVRAYDLETPQGWPDLDAYLKDLAAGLDALHGFVAHPVGQSLRQGTQTSRSLRHAEHPAIRAFFAAIDTPIRRHIASLGGGDDPARGRNTGGYEMAGIWSVRLRSGGRHVDHVHPDGWLSSAFYVALPDRGEGREGWLKFGEPGAPTRPKLEAEHFVEPKPGRLVLFPSYMWHGTIPFSGDRARLTMAFDLKPAAPAA